FGCIESKKACATFLTFSQHCLNMSYITTDGRQMKTNENFKATAAIASSNEVKEKKENTRKRKNFNICIQPATARIETNLQTKYLSLANIHNDNNNNNNNNSNNVNSKVKCKQYNVIRHKWQKPWWSHHQQQSSKQFIFRRANKMQNFLQKLIVIRTVILLFIACFLPSIQAGCRYEPSRSCEAICRPVWSSMDNDNYQLLHNNATTTTSTTTDGTANSVQILKNFNANDYNCTIRALVLMPDDERYVASLKRVVPILQVAEQRIHARGLLPPFIHFDWMPQDDKCDAAFAAVKAMDGIVKNCSHVFFGPVCDYSLAGVARIVKYFNSHGTPLISVGGSTYDFEKPKTKCSDEFYMLVRTGMLSFESISELTITVMKSYKWSRSILFYDANGQYSVAGQHTCYLMMTSLGKQMRSENMTFAQYRTSGNVTNRTAEIAREIGNKNTDFKFMHHIANSPEDYGDRKMEKGLRSK
ncbi:hypothetical protein DOY81_006098, partial [Sarcophaga bullata]